MRTLSFVLILAVCRPGPACAVSPPDAELDSARRAIALAQKQAPRGEAAQGVQEASTLLQQAEAAAARKKYRDAQRLAGRAEAVADLAAAKAKLAKARIEVDEKAARNEDLRRRLLLSAGAER